MTSDAMAAASIEAGPHLSRVCTIHCFCGNLYNHVCAGAAVCCGTEKSPSPWTDMRKQRDCMKRGETYMHQLLREAQHACFCTAPLMSIPVMLTACICKMNLHFTWHTQVSAHTCKQTQSSTQMHLKNEKGNESARARARTLTHARGEICTRTCENTQAHLYMCLSVWLYKPEKIMTETWICVCSFNYTHAHTHILHTHTCLYVYVPMYM